MLLMSYSQDGIQLQNTQCDMQQNMKICAALDNDFTSKSLTIILNLDDI